MSKTDRLMTEAEAAEMLASAETVNVQPSSPTETWPDWRRIVARLLAAAGRHIRPGPPLSERPAPFSFIVRYRDDAPFPDYGPGVVVEMRENAEPDWSAGPVGSHARGRRADARVIFMYQDCVLPVWVEACDVEGWPERYAPPDDGKFG